MKLAIWPNNNRYRRVGSYQVLRLLSRSFQPEPRLPQPLLHSNTFDQVISLFEIRNDGRQGLQEDNRKVRSTDSAWTTRTTTGLLQAATSQDSASQGIAGYHRKWRGIMGDDVWGKVSLAFISLVLETGRNDGVYLWRAAPALENAPRSSPSQVGCI